MPAPRRLLDTAATVFVPLLIPVLAVMFGWTSYAGVLAGFGPVARVEATVTADPEAGLLPVVTADDLPVRFTTASGRRVVTLVAVRGLPDPRPATLPIEYSVADPSRVRALEHAGHVVGATTPTLVILADLGAGAWFATGLLRRRSGERRARLAGPVHQARYALFLDPDGVLVMLVFTGTDPAARPAWILPVDVRARQRIPPAGQVTLHGNLEDGDIVAPTVDQEPVRPDGLLTYAHAEAVLDLLNARSLDD
jgi:hypothetical protein